MRHVFVSQRDLEDEYVRGLGADVVWGALQEGGLVALSVIKAWRAQWRAQARETAQHNAQREASMPRGTWLGDSRVRNPQVSDSRVHDSLPQDSQARDSRVKNSLLQDSLSRDPLARNLLAHDSLLRTPQVDDSLPQEPPTMEQVAEFCRSSNNKVPSALSVLDCITPQSALRINSIARLLDAAAGQKA